jgi:hypothetical protein
MNMTQRPAKRTRHNDKPFYIVKNHRRLAVGPPLMKSLAVNIFAADKRLAVAYVRFGDPCLVNDYNKK